MLPVIFNLAGVPISSFGVFLTLSLIAALFTAWRLARAYDLAEEQVVNLTLLSFIGGVVGARVYAVVTNPAVFNSLDKILAINKFPGLSFWGGLIGGVLVFSYLTTRSKFSFWQLLDFAACSLLIGMVVGGVGCWFGGCAYGVPSNLIIAAEVVGQVGRRLPISLIESLILLAIFWRLWGETIRFHFNGKIASLFLMAVGGVKLLTENLHADPKITLLGTWLSLGHIFALSMLVLGVVVFYVRSKRELLADLRFVWMLVVQPERRSLVLLNLKKSWYNQTVNWKIKLVRLQRKLNVRSTPEKYR